MEWNNGTIFRIYITSGDTSIINTNVDISQQELNNKVYIGVENFVLEPDLSTLQKSQYWDTKTFIQLQSINLPPYIDYSSYTDNTNLNGGNTRIFARLPLIAIASLKKVVDETYIRYGVDRVLNKDSILYEMMNNSSAVSTGNLNVRILDENGYIIPDGYITSFSLTIVIYKPSNKYN
jgi:hypothetical protein